MAFSSSVVNLANGSSDGRSGVGAARAGFPGGGDWMGPEGNEAEAGDEVRLICPASTRGREDTQSSFTPFPLAKLLRTT